MSDRYIRGCENSTLANVLGPFCTALGGQTPLYCDCILYRNEVQTSLYCVRILYRNEVQTSLYCVRILYRIGSVFCTELHHNTCVFCMDGQKLLYISIFYYLLSTTPFDNIYNAESLTLLALLRYLNISKKGFRHSL